MSESLKIKFAPENDHHETFKSEAYRKDKDRWDKLKTIYKYSFITNLLLSQDHGILPASTFEQKKEQGIGDVFQGFQGSLVFVGLMMGSVAAGYLFTRYSCKKIIIFSYTLMILGFILFPFSGDNKFLLGFSRMVTGFFQVFMLVYFPVWVDHFGEHNKTIWISYLQIGPPLGVFMGYAITAFFNEINVYVPFISWRWAFYVQVILLLPGLYCYTTMPSRLMATNHIINESKEDLDTEEVHKIPILEASVFTPRATFHLANAKKDYDKILKQQEVDDLYSIDSDTDLNTNKDDEFCEYAFYENNKKQPIEQLDNKLIEEGSLDLSKEKAEDRDFDKNFDAKKYPFKRQQTMNQDNPGYLLTIKTIFTKYRYVSCVLTISVLYFVVTGIQFWVSDYCRVVLGMSKGYVYIMFAIVSITAPTLGVLVGGRQSSNLGGYTGEYAILFCLINVFFTCVFAIPIPFLDNFIVIGILLWLGFFFAAAAMPTQTGLMISATPENMRPVASSTAQFVENGLGYVPAPLMYSLVNHCTGGEKSRWGMTLIAFWTLWALILMIYAFLKQRKIRRERRKNNQDIKKKTQQNNMQHGFVEVPLNEFGNSQEVTSKNLIGDENKLPSDFSFNKTSNAIKSNVKKSYLTNEDVDSVNKIYGK